MINLSAEILSKVLSDSYEGTILEIVDDCIQRIQSSTDNREYVAKQANVVAACINELKKRKAQA